MLEKTIPDINQDLIEDARKKTFGIPPVVACIERGATAHLPELRPCFELRWGQSERDEMETNDDEIICIVASNPYTDVIFKDLTVVAIVTEFNGSPVPDLPDGTPSVEITPSHIIFFGDLPRLDPHSIPRQTQSAEATETEAAARPGGGHHRHSCRTPARPLDPTSVAREVVLISRGARPGEYEVRLEYTFSVEYLCPGTDEFKLELVKS